MTNQLEEFRAIIQLFERDAGVSCDMNQTYIQSGIVNRLFIKTGLDDPNELMLRLNTHTEELVVARVRFIHERQGYGEKLLELLTQYGTENGYHKIVFESVLTEGMNNFLIKHEFQKASKEKYEMNWIKSIG